MPLASDESFEHWRERISQSGMKFVKITKHRNGAIYQVFTAADPEKAKTFLRNEPIDKPLYYIVVETPDGNWGTDYQGLYLEKLRPWQLDTRNVDCEGFIAGLIDSNQSIRAAAGGRSDNFVVQVACGQCDHEWIDGVRYRDLTTVRCPACRALNRINSDGFTYTEIEY